MGVKGLLQPPGSTVITLRSAWTGETLSLTLDELMAMGQELVPNCNTLLMSSYNTSYGYLFRLNHIDDVTDLYLRNDLVSGVDNCIAYDQSINLSGSNVLYGSKYHISDGIEAQSVAWNLSSRYYEGKNYSYDSNSNESLPPYIFYTTANYENLYINGSLVDKNTGGGAGSGYIGNSLLSNKKMIGYNIPTSSEESTKTESVEDAKSKATSGKPKIGNGYARITLLREIIPNPPDEWKTEVDALKDFEIDGKKFINSDIPAGFDGDGFTNKGDYTYVCVASSTNWQNSFNFSHIATIRITTNSGGGYDVAYENLDHVYMKFQSHISMYGFGMCQLRTGSIDPYYFWPYNSITWQQSYEMATSQTHFDNLTNLFKYLNVHYRNVNLFIDGECWALA